MDVHVAVSDDGRTLEIIEGQGALMRAYEDLRRTEGATLIQAIWATRYPSSEIESYFAAERADLLRAGKLRIERLIAADVIDADVMSKLRHHAHGLPNLTLWEIEPVVLECNLCEYVRERTSYIKVLVVLAGAEKSAQVAVYMDTRREPGMVGVVYSLKGWFESLKRLPLAVSE